MWILIALTACEGPENVGTEDDPATACNEANEACEPEVCFGEGGKMLPGSDCVACHSQGNLVEHDGERESGPLFGYGGTVYLDADGTEPVEGVTVRLTDSLGQVYETTSNSVGNFYSEDQPAFPATVEVETAEGVLTMWDPVADGSCAVCHQCGVSGKIYVP